MPQTWQTLPPLPRKAMLYDSMAVFRDAKDGMRFPPAVVYQGLQAYLLPKSLWQEALDLAEQTLRVCNGPLFCATPPVQSGQELFRLLWAALETAQQVGTTSDTATGDATADLDEATGDATIDEAIGDATSDQATGDATTDEATGDATTDEATGDATAGLDAASDSLITSEFATVCPTLSRKQKRRQSRKDWKASRRVR